jgi:hypothetical protein
MVQLMTWRMTNLRVLPKPANELQGPRLPKQLDGLPDKYYPFAEEKKEEEEEEEVVAKGKQAVEVPEVEVRPYVAPTIQELAEACRLIFDAETGDAGVSTEPAGEVAAAADVGTAQVASEVCYACPLFEAQKLKHYHNHFRRLLYSLYLTLA